MTAQVTTTIASAILGIVETERALDGAIYDPVTNTWAPATPASQAAAAAAIDASVGAVLDTLPFPLSLGSLGSISRAQMDTAATKIKAALKAYVVATTKV